MRRFWCSIFFALFCASAFAETPFASALAMMDNYSPVIISARHELDKNIKERKVTNNMNDPEVEVEYGKYKDTDPEMEVTLKQGFCFPTLYARRKKLFSISAQKDSIAYKIKRLEEAEYVITLCTKIVLMNQRIKIDSARYANAKNSEELFSMGMEQGVFGIVEVNTAKRELFATQNAYYTSKAEKEKYCYQLKAVLGGNLPACVNDTALPQIIVPDTIPNPYTRLRELTNKETELAVRVAKAESHPNLNVGYKYLRDDGRRGHGFVAGTSIPLFSGRGKKSLAEANGAYENTDIQAKEDDFVQRMQSIRNRYNSYLALNDKYDYALFNNTRDVLSKSLRAGRITIVEYYTNLDALYNTVYEYIEMQINMNIAAYILDLYAEHQW